MKQKSFTISIHFQVRKPLSLRVFRLIFCSVIFLLFSCSSNIVYKNLIRKIKTELNLNNYFKAAIIIPGAGCPGCISYAEDFVRNNLNNNQILFIFTRIISPKELRAKLNLGSDILPNLVLDTINEFAVPLDFDEAYYPLIIYFDNLNEKPYESISPGTEFKYDNLLSFLNEGIPSINLLSAVESKIASITGLSDICDSIIYVPLETFHDVVLSRISHIIVDQDRVFLSDQNDGIYVFNFDGKLMSKIGCKGSGPEEYQSLIAGKFSIDALKKEILIPDFIGQKILVYTFDNVLRAKIKLPYRVTDISSLNDELYILYIQSLMDRKDSFNPIRVIDRSGTESFMVKSFNYPVLNFISAGQFEKFNEDIFYTEPNNDTIFKISYDLKKTPDNVIRLGKYKPPIEIYQDINRWIDYYSEYVYTKNIFHCSEGILFALYFKDLTYSGLYRYTDKTPIIFYLGSRNKGIVDNIDNGPPFNSFFRVSNGYIIDILEPMILRSEVYSRVRKESKLHKIMSLSEIEDNPIIRLIKLKYEI